MSHKETLSWIIPILVGAVFWIIFIAIFGYKGWVMWVLNIVSVLWWIWVIYAIIHYFVNRGENNELKEERRDFKKMTDKELKECNFERRFPVLTKKFNLKEDYMAF